MMEMKTRPTVAHLLAAEARETNPALRPAYLMASACDRHLDDWLAEAGNLQEEYAAFLVEVTTGLPMDEVNELALRRMMLADDDPEAVEIDAQLAFAAEYDEDRMACVQRLRYPPVDDDGEPRESIRIRRMTRREIITALGMSAWTEPSTEKQVRLLAACSNFSADEIRLMDYGDWMQVQSALQGFTEPHTLSPS